MPDPVARPRRRFPLTLTALGLSAVAIPLYLVGTAADEEAKVDTPTVAAEPAAVEQTAVGRSTADAKKEEAAPVTSSAVAMAEPASAEAAPAGAPAPPMAKRAGKRKSKISLGRHDALAGDGDMGGEADEDMPVALEEERGGYDEQLQANRLTAGRTSDLVDRHSLDELRAKATRQDQALAQAIPSHDRAGQAPAPGNPPNVLEIGFVLDTTGSMGDELSYLKVEMRSIAQTIAQEFPGVEQRYALVAYRDHGDAYIVRHHDFEPLDAFVKHLGAQSAGGGGDFPEAMDIAMEAAARLDWSPSAAQLTFLVADAPPHAADYQRYVSATQKLADADVSVYPVASSGVETVCEYLMRWAARATGGEYIFLTDHSGIGNPHADPHVDQYELKTLRDHMLEVIRIELGAGQQVHPPQPREDKFCGLYHGRHDAPTWWDRHGLFVFVLGATFLFGFAGDTVLSQMRARRERS